MSQPSIAFWYDFASNYSWLAARRIAALAAARGVAVAWEPFLLGPIFASQGWDTSPFNIYPAKGAHAWRDIERQAAALGLPLVRPAPFPQNSLLAARVGLAVGPAGRPAFSEALFREEFERGRSISDTAVLAEVLAGLGHDAGAVLAAAASELVKTALRQQGERAKRLGLFGAPTFVTADGEVFWGNDRLEAALAWAMDGPLPGLAR
ncbi:2-hydroxychromene-2-carboxylate isomerase [Chelatococcus reniformis]|uniref:2-hydroxychromene-2-carboxylate isomerase n=1 Tax=Chelatococcus reniformis TaxID=1494448 RepID=A0A916XCN9_9HYPH|nr:2-hydroxychromene-2-carboxylate isomerase [Chelatococcus reniformis]GGC64186.1 2-hydroxychromene-2-carboxylate isomerase [Chelatococcus reniformis]